MSVSSALEEDYIGALFRELDRAHTGALQKPDIAAAIVKVGLPASYAGEVFSRADVNRDGVVGADDFRAFVQAKEAALRDLFDLIDENGRGVIDSKDLLSSLQTLHFQPSAKQVQTLFVKIDRHREGNVSYEEFRRFFALLQPADLVRIVSDSVAAMDNTSSAWLEELRQQRTAQRHSSRTREMEARLAQLQARHALECRPLEEQLKAEGLGWFARHRLGGDLDELQARQRKEAERLRRSLERGAEVPEESTGVLRIALSGCSAVFAQTVLHPIETTKVRLQNDYGANRRYGNFLRGTYIILKEEGLFHGLYKGMAPSAMRELLYSSLRFGLYVPIKQLLGETDPATTPLWKKFTSGGLAAAIGSALANPTDLLKARMQADTCMPPTSMTAHMREIYHDGGVLGFWKGTSTTVVRAIILGAVKLGSYDECKKQFHQLGLRGVLCQFVASATTGVLTVAASAPADFTRTRIMAAKQLAQQSGVQVQYSGPIDVLYQTVKYEGVTALWRGAVPQWLRIGPYTIIQFIVWERLCKMCGTNAV